MCPTRLQDPSRHTVGYVSASYAGSSYVILCEYLYNCNQNVISSVDVSLQCMQGYWTVFSVLNGIDSNYELTRKVLSHNNRDTCCVPSLWGFMYGTCDRLALVCTFGCPMCHITN